MQLFAKTEPDEFTEKYQNSFFRFFVQETYTSLRQWETKTNRIWGTASKLVPIPLRTTPTTTPLPARTLVSYITKEVWKKKLLQYE